jgi:Arc/MetJ-type ribon-helix-helix transcriptional regulator
MPQHPKISVRLPPELHALLLARVGHSGRVSDVIREAIETYLGCARPTDRPTASALSDIVFALSDKVDTLAAQVADMQTRLGQHEGQETAPLPAVPQRPTPRPTRQQQPGAAVAPHIQRIAAVAAEYDKLSLAQLAHLLYERGVYRARDKQTGEEKPVNRGTLKLWLDRARAAGLLERPSSLAKHA